MVATATLVSEHAGGASYADMAARYGLNRDSVRARVNRHRRRGEQDAQAARIRELEARLAALEAGRGDVPFPVLLRGKPITLDVPRWTDCFRLTGDALIVGDWHIPTTAWELVTLVARFGERHLPRGRRQLVIAGDLVNMDAVSAYDHIVTPVPLAHELAAAAGCLEHMARVFDDIWYIMGNHEYRLAKCVGEELADTAFGALIRGGLDGKLRVSVQSFAELCSGGHRWRITHQRGYSRNKGVVASQLAAKHACNVASFHQHHLAQGRDTFNRWTWVDGGGLFDAERMAYVSLADSTAPVMANGFVFVRNGTAHLLSPFPSLTDWSLWGMEQDAAPAIAEAVQRERRVMGLVV